MHIKTIVVLELKTIGDQSVVLSTDLLLAVALEISWVETSGHCMMSFLEERYQSLLHQGPVVFLMLSSIYFQEQLHSSLLPFPFVCMRLKTGLFMVAVVLGYRGFLFLTCSGIMVMKVV